MASTKSKHLKEEAPSLSANGKLRVTLLSSEWRSTQGSLSTINRELAIQLAKHPNLEISVLVPQCSVDDKNGAANHKVRLIEADKMPGSDPVRCLAFVPDGHTMDCVIGHGVTLGQQIPLIKRQHCHCKWIQVVHTAAEELGMFKSNADSISKGEKMQQTELDLCELADQVVTIGPKLADAYKRYLRSGKKHQDVINLTPSIFTEFLDVKHSVEKRKKFCVLVFGQGDSEDFNLNGYDIAAKAIADLKDKSYQLMFFGAQNGKEEEITQKILKHGIPRNQLRVRSFNESREKLARLFCEVDLAVMPSRTEGFGLTALEALSACLPVLVSGNSGLGEALQKIPFGSYSVVDSEDPADWAEAIKAIHQKDRKIRLEETKFLREKFAATYSWESQCNVLVDKMIHLTSDFSENKAVSERKDRKRPSSFGDTQPSKQLKEELVSCKPDDGSSRSAENGKRSSLVVDTQGSEQPVIEFQVKIGTPNNDDLELLANGLTDSWKEVGRRLEIDEERLVGFHKQNEKVSEKAYSMLLHWKRRDGFEATYQVLHDALCHHLVNRRDLAERFYCHNK